MYINNYLCCVESKDENKCGRIFRPWDNEVLEKSNSKDSSQDNTISTTTIEEEDVEIKVEVVEEDFKFVNSKPTTIKSKVEKHSFRPLHKSVHQKHHQTKLVANLENLNNSAVPINTPCITNSILPPPPMDYMTEVYNPLYPEVVQTNLAQSLGLPQNDPLLMESLAQGYALEEYARVLSQDHQAKILAAKKQRPKKYKCPHCDVGFSNNGQLKGHVRIHTGERPFKCDEKECGKTFTRNEELTRHKRIHSGLRPFPCTHCGKRFGRKDHLKKHSRTHFQPRGVYAVPVMLPFEAWASGSVNGYPFIPMY